MIGVNPLLLGYTSNLVRVAITCCVLSLVGCDERSLPSTSVANLGDDDDSTSSTEVAEIAIQRIDDQPDLSEPSGPITRYAESLCWGLSIRETASRIPNCEARALWGFSSGKGNLDLFLYVPNDPRAIRCTFTTTPHALSVCYRLASWSIDERPISKSMRLVKVTESLETPDTLFTHRAVYDELTEVR